MDELDLIDMDDLLPVIYALLISYFLYALWYRIGLDEDPYVPDTSCTTVLPSEREKFALLRLTLPADCREQQLPPPPPSPSALQQLSELGKSVRKRLNRKRRMSERRMWKIDPLKVPEHTTPLIVFINPKSGGKKGDHLLRQLCHLLPQYQICDLSTDGPERMLQTFRQVPNLRVLVAGGDGTVGWVLSSIEQTFPIERDRPPVAVLPLGTGNDLARALNWGHGYAGGNLVPILSKVADARTRPLDRWSVQLDSSTKNTFGVRAGPEPESLVASNYIGIGVDAQIALDFHRTREASSHLFVSRFINKCWYAIFGGKNLIFPTCHDFTDQVTLECDGVVVPLPRGIQGVVLLNIQSYGGGANLWGTTQTNFGAAGEGYESRPRSESFCGAEPSMHDQMLEVVGVGSSFELALGQVGICSQKRICQASEIKLSTKHSIPIQVDGEPRVFPAGTITVAHRGQAPMLTVPTRVLQCPAHTEMAVLESLDWAATTGMINNQQRDTLYADILRRIQEKQNLDSE